MRQGLKVKKIHCILEFNQSQCVYFKTRKRTEAENNGDKDGKVSYLKWTFKSRYMSHKIFDNVLVVIRKNKVTLTLNKLASIEMHILELSKVLSKCMNSILITFKKNMVTTQEYYSQTLIVGCMRLKLRVSIKIFAVIKKCLILVIIRPSQNTMMIQRKKSLEKRKIKLEVLRFKNLSD